MTPVMDDFLHGLIGGVILGAVVAIVVAGIVSTGDLSHQVGASQQVCMVIEDQQLADGTHSIRNKCVSGMQVIEWLRAEGAR